MVILAIFAVIAIPGFSKWNGKRAVENDIKKAYTLIENARAKAFTEKRDYKISFNPVATQGNKLEQIADGNVIYSLSTKYDLKFDNSTTAIDISHRGVYKTSASVYSVEFAKNPEYTCIVISPLRARLGKWDGSNCNAK
jgi:Tfp pilus assembly protein FimT